ncbi:MAG: hypothetical protein ACWGHO_02400 [Candidatus Moraniibacteriota bacterium]
MSKKLEKLKAAFSMNKGERSLLIMRVLREMELGLCGKKSSLKMLPAFVWPPTGNEQGTYLAIDFGGTNLRILSVTLKGKGKIAEPKMCSHVIGQKIICGTKTGLGNFIVDKVLDFMQSQKMDIAMQTEIGFTFSFPIRQESIVSGILVNWTKGFTIKGVVGQDVVGLLQKTFDKRGFPQIKIKAILNDTVGTLLRGCYENSNCDVGVILGTGTNASYIEKVSNIVSDKNLTNESETMLINMEWGGFDLVPQTDYDKELDRNSSNPGEQFLEKMVSARYLGELVALIVNDFIAEGEFSTAMRTMKAKDFFTTQELSQIMGDRHSALPITKKILSEKGIVRASQKDRFLIKKITKIVMNRSACLAATMMIAVIKKNDCCSYREHAIAIDGSLFEKAYRYKEVVSRTINSTLGRKKKAITPFVCKDGSGVGAAVAVAIVSK